MCTLIIYRNPDKDSKWPVLIAENRDENPSRLWRDPSYHWSEHPRIIAGLDLANREKGSWLGINKDGVFCTIINRSGTMGQKSDKQSRGGLVIKALTFSSAAEATASLTKEINPELYQGFYLIIADKESTQVMISDGLSMSVQEVNDGLHMVTSRGIDNIELCSRTKTHILDWRNASLPNPDTGNWDEWINILARKSTKDDVRNGMSLDDVKGVSTVSSSLVALNKDGHDNRLLFAPGKPKDHDYKNIDAVSETKWIERLRQIKSTTPTFSSKL